jgi:hypothetical protein
MTTRKMIQLLNGGQKAISNALNFETKYNILRSASVTARFTLNTIDFKNDSSLQWRQQHCGLYYAKWIIAGQELLVESKFYKNLLNNLELRFDYEGRKPSNSRTVHRGTASVSALF